MRVRNLLGGLPLNRLCQLIGNLSLLLTLVSSVSARTWIVRPDGSGDAPTPQAAMDSAQAWDEVVLAPGLYTYSTDFGVVMKSGVVLRSEAGPEVTTIDGQLRHGTVVRCVDTGPGTRIESLTLRGGSAGDRFPPLPGAGIYCHGSEIVIRGCIIEGNSVGKEGVTLAAGISSWESNISIEGCLVVNNLGTGVFVSGNPASAYRLTMRETLVADNMGQDQLGLRVNIATADVEKCTFVRNAVTFSSFSVVRFVGNTVFGGGGFGMNQIESGIVQRNILSDSQYGVYCDNCASALSFECNDVWGSTIALYTGIAEQTGINGNISSNPLFCGAKELDFHLESVSPAANQSCGVMGGQGMGCGATPARPASWGWVKGLYR